MNKGFDGENNGELSIEEEVSFAYDKNAQRIEVGDRVIVMDFPKERTRGWVIEGIEIRPMDHEIADGPPLEYLLKIKIPKYVKIKHQDGSRELVDMWRLQKELSVVPDIEEEK